MNLKKIHVEFSPEEVRRIMTIALDENAIEALAFFREILSKRVEKALQAH